MSLHLCPIEPSLEPEDVPDPVEGVEFPRERKPWKRDRHAIYWKMQRAINQREWRTLRPFGPGRQHATSLQARSRYLNRAEHEVRRALWKIDDLGRMHAASRRQHLDWLRRIVLFARELRLAAAEPSL